MYDKLPKELFFIRELLLLPLWRSPEVNLKMCKLANEIQSCQLL
jgi:hypothetical protein